MRAIVIGATGFIGANVARALLSAGHEVRATRRRSSDLSAIEDLQGRLELVEGDILDPDSIRRALDGRHWLFHTAGYYPTVSLDLAAALEKGVRGMRNVLEAAAATPGLERVVYTSSLSTVGPPRDPGRRLADERDYYVPGSAAGAYHEVKWALESEAYRYAAQGLATVVVNPSICFGPHDVKPTSGRLILELARGRLPAFVDGEINAVDVRDVAAGHVAAAERGRPGERYILGNENVRVRDLVFRIARLSGVEPPRTVVPAGAAHAFAYATELAARYVTGRPPFLPLENVDIIRHARFLDPSRARRELGLPQTPIERGIEDALVWFRARGRL